MSYNRVLCLILLTTAFLTLTACVTDYSRFYRPVPGLTPETIASYRAAPPTDNPVVERSAPLKSGGSALIEAYARRGYSPIGSSAFNSSKAEYDGAAIRQARNVGADLVLIFSPHYTGSTKEIVPVVVPTVVTSNTSIDGSIVGTHSTMPFSGSATTTTEIDTTVLTPIVVDHVDYGAVYFIKRKFAFGAMFRDLNDAERQQLQSNKGVYVRVIVDRSPAYYADILNGDIIVKIGDDEVTNTASATEIIKRHAGQTVFVTLYRNGNRFAKQVTLN